MATEAKAVIHLDRLATNLSYIQSRQIRSHHPQLTAFAVVKADAYGHGLIPVCKTLVETSKQPIGLATTDCQAALTIRQHFLDTSILHLHGPSTRDELIELSQQHIQLVVHSPYQLLLFQKQTAGFPISVWIKSNSGMNRLGQPLNQLVDIWQQAAMLQANGKIKLRGLINHFSNADEVNPHISKRQLTKLCQCIADLTKIAKVEHLSLSNSAALLNGLTQYYSPLLATAKVSHEVSRPGIALYGGRAIQKINTETQPVMVLTAPIIAIQNIHTGESVGYGLSWTAKQPSLIAVVKIGYGDGYPRHIDNAEVSIHQCRYPIVGRVSMDLITVDITSSTHDNQHRVAIGDWVELWGDDIHVSAVADWASCGKHSSLDYQLLTQLTGRVKRVYVNPT